MQGEYVTPKLNK